jgi:alanine racemase
MDLTLIDVTNIPEVALGDQVTLLGRQRTDSDAAVTAEELARISGTLSYEVTCGIGVRVPRVYV